MAVYSIEVGIIEDVFSVFGKIKMPQYGYPVKKSVLRRLVKIITGRIFRPEHCIEQHLHLAVYAEEKPGISFENLFRMILLNAVLYSVFGETPLPCECST